MKTLLAVLIMIGVLALAACKESPQTLVFETPTNIPTRGTSSTQGAILTPTPTTTPTSSSSGPVETTAGPLASETTSTTATAAEPTEAPPTTPGPEEPHDTPTPTPTPILRAEPTASPTAVETPVVVDAAPFAEEPDATPIDVDAIEGGWDPHGTVDILHRNSTSVTVLATVTDRNYELVTDNRRREPFALKWMLCPSPCKLGNTPGKRVVIESQPPVITVSGLKAGTSYHIQVFALLKGALFPNYRLVNEFSTTTELAGSCPNAVWWNGDVSARSDGTADTCLVNAPAGSTAFVSGNKYYIKSKFSSCPIGAFDSSNSNCFVMQKPPGGFFRDNSDGVLGFYAKPQGPHNTCSPTQGPDGTGQLVEIFVGLIDDPFGERNDIDGDLWYCLYATAPPGTQAFEENGNFYTTPLASCPIAAGGGRIDHVGCYLGKPPDYRKAFVSNDKFYYQ